MLGSGTGRIARWCAFGALTAILAAGVIYNGIVGGLVSGWLSGLAVPWLPAVVITAIVITLGTVLNALVGPLARGRIWVLACLVVLAPFLVNVAEGEASALIQRGWAAKLLWCSPATVAAVAALQVLVWRAGRRRGWIRGGSAATARADLRRRAIAEWVDGTYRQVMVGRYRLCLGVRLPDGQVIDAAADLCAWLRQSGGMLLVGEPGSGKTCKAVEVLDHLCAAGDVAPIMLTLAAYGSSDGRGPSPEGIDDWIADQLAADQYSLHPRVTRRLLDHAGDGEVVIILDAFDRVPPQARVQCAREIARFRAARPHIAVCVIVTGGLVTDTDLALPGTAQILPASRAEIRAALKEAGIPRKHRLYAAIDKDPQARDFFGLPLVLSLVAQLTSGAVIPGDTPTLEKLTESYITDLLARPPPLAETADLARRWLALVADNADHGRFRLYDLQPRMLDQPLRVRFYNWLPGSLVVAIATAFLVVGSAPYHGWRGLLSLFEHLATGALVGLLIAWVSSAGAQGKLEPLVAGLRFDRTALRHIWSSGLKGIQYSLALLGALFILLECIVGGLWLTDPHFRATQSFEMDVFGADNPRKALVGIAVIAAKTMAAGGFLGSAWGLLRATATGLRRPDPDGEPAQPHSPETSDHPAETGRLLRRSGRSSLFAAVAGSVAVAGVVGAVELCGLLLHASTGLGALAWALILVAAAGFGLAFGGWAFLAYLGIRVDLIRTGQSPVLLGRFLRNLTQRRMLYHLPGRYEFVHETVRQSLTTPLPDDCWQAR